MPHLFRTN